jgi:hypothetical protein
MNSIKLSRFFDKSLKDVGNILLVRSNNTYMLFNRFKITNNTMCNVYDIKTKETIEFSSLKCSMSYCILVSNSKYTDSRRLYSLDLKLSSLYTDINIHKSMLRNADSIEKRMLYANKLQEDTYQKKLITKEINSYINSSSTLIYRKFAKKTEIR